MSYNSGNRPENNNLRIGVIGVGRMGRNHCRVLSTLRHACLAGVSDANAETGQMIAQQFETIFYPSTSALFEAVDAVIIATPTPSHFSLAMAALAQGLHVLIEKPIAATLAEAEQLVKAAATHKTIVQVGHIERFNPAYTELKHVLDEINVAAINFRRLSPYVGSNTDVDVVLDLMIHDIDLVLDLVQQQPLTVNAVGLTAFSGDIDHAVVQLTFPSTPLLTLMVSRLTEQKVRAIDVTGLEAYVEGDLLNKRVLLHRSMTGEYLNHNQHTKYRQESLIERIHVPLVEPLLLELQHFIDCIAEQRQPLVSATAGWQALTLATQIRDEIRRKLTVVKPVKPALATEQIAGWRTATPLELR